MKRRALLKSIVLGAAVAFPIARLKVVDSEPSSFSDRLAKAVLEKFESGEVSVTLPYASQAALEISAITGKDVSVFDIGGTSERPTFHLVDVIEGGTSKRYGANNERLSKALP